MRETATGQAKAGVELRYSEMASPIGPLTLTASQQGLCAIEFGAYADERERLHRWAARWYGTFVLERDEQALAETVRQLTAYFAGTLRTFTIPLDLQGTPFQRRVWEALTAIPYGETRSYKDIAISIGQPLAMRAVGGANNRNPVPVIVPCHRVIGASGGMVGYGGGVDIKVRLLAFESGEGNAASICLPQAGML